MRHRFAALFVLATGTAHAEAWLPAEGIWQIDGNNGSGVSLDVRDGTIGIALYTYDDDGDPTWYTGAGALVDDALEANLVRPRSDGSIADARTLALAFDSSTRGTLQLGDNAPITIRHATFGADYIGDITLATGNDEVSVIPDLRARWLFSRRDPNGGYPETHDIVFRQLEVTSERVLFHSGNEGDFVPEHFVFACSPQAVLDSMATCTFDRPRDLLDPPPPTLATFHPRALSATRIADGNAEWVAFRIPDTINAPVTGIWRYAAIEGQGITLDVRPDAIAVGVFGYDDDGEATWSLAVGAPGENDVLDANLLAFTGGSCLGCTHAEPTVASTQDLHIAFDGATRARLTLGDAAPFAVALLSYGDGYQLAPLQGDPDAAAFGPHALPQLLGRWAVHGEESAMPNEQSLLIDIDLVSSTISGSQGMTRLRATGYRSSPLNQPSGIELLCGGEAAEVQTLCRITETGGAGDPPPPPLIHGTFRPQDIAPMRMSGISPYDGGRRYVFRIPYVLEAPPQ